MTTPYGDEDDVQEPDKEPEPDKEKSSEFRRNQKVLTDKARERDEAVARAEAATRKLAFFEAGINMGHPAAKYFVAGYDGDLEPDKIKAAAEEAGLTNAPASTSDSGGESHPDPSALNPQAAADAAAFSALNQATGQQGDTGSVNHRAAMEKVAFEAMRAGANAPEAIAAYMSKHGLPVAEDER